MARSTQQQRSGAAQTSVPTLVDSVSQSMRTAFSVHTGSWWIMFAPASGVGTRRACCVLALHRSMYLYRSRRPEQAVLFKRIREIAAMRVRYGYRRIHILLQREGWPVGRTRVYRLYRLEGLQM